VRTVVSLSGSAGRHRLRRPANTFRLELGERNANLI
jgi:hypothetical protein